MDERVYQIALGLLNGVGPTTAKQLVEAVGSLEGVFKEKASNFRHFHGLRLDSGKGLKREAALIRAEEELEFIEQNQVQVYYYQDPNYPAKLKQCNDAPIVLFTLGKLHFNQRNISIVGTRKATSYGRKMTEKLIEDLAAYNVQVISGLARGIDKAAHENALKNKLSTIGVLGHGLDTMYPAAHRQLAKKMLNSGGVITEFISGTIGEPTNFPKRNRIVAGLSDATIVIESTETGGSLITANLANDYNREVFAVPGPLDRECSSGCNNLIKRSKAHLITSAEDIAHILGWEEQEQAETLTQESLSMLSDLESKIVQIFRLKGELDSDALARESEMDVSNLSTHLFNLEMKGLIHSLPGNRYTLG